MSLDTADSGGGKACRWPVVLQPLIKRFGTLIRGSTEGSAQPQSEWWMFSV